MHTHALDAQGVANLSFEREFGKLIGIQDTLAKISGTMGNVIPYSKAVALSRCEAPEFVQPYRALLSTANTYRTWNTSVSGWNTVQANQKAVVLGSALP